jgi:transposase
MKRPRKGQSHAWMRLYHELTRRGYDCVTVNPIQIRAQSKGQIRETGKEHIDSAGIGKVLKGIFRPRLNEPGPAQL